MNKILLSAFFLFATTTAGFVADENDLVRNDDKGSGSSFRIEPRDTPLTFSEISKILSALPEQLKNSANPSSHFNFTIQGTEDDVNFSFSVHGQCHKN